MPAFGLLLIAALWIATGVHLQSTQRALLNTTKHDTKSFVAAFERYTWRALRDADRTARLVKHEYEQHGAVTCRGSSLPAWSRTQARCW